MARAFHRHRHVAHDPFEDVVDRHHAQQPAIFVNDQRNVRPRFSEQLDHLEDGLGLGHKQGALHGGFEIGRLAAQAARQEVFGMHDAQNDVQAAMADREPGMGALGDLAPDLFGESSTSSQTMSWRGVISVLIDRSPRRSTLVIMSCSASSKTPA